GTLGLCHDGARIVEPDDGAFQQGARGGQLVKILRRVVTEHDVDGTAIGDGAAVLKAQRVRVDHVPRPAKGRGLAAEQVRETELFAMRRIAEDGESRPGGRSTSVRGRGEGAAKARARAAIRIAASRPELPRGPDLTLTGGLVAVVLERGEATVQSLEHVEAPPEERGPQRSARVDLLGEREVGQWQAVERLVAGEEPVGEPTQQPVEGDGGVGK